MMNRNFKVLVEGAGWYIVEAQEEQKFFASRVGEKETLFIPLSELTDENLKSGLVGFVYTGDNTLAIYFDFMNNKAILHDMEQDKYYLAKEDVEGLKHMLSGALDIVEYLKLV